MLELYIITVIINWFVFIAFDEAYIDMLSCKEYKIRNIKNIKSKKTIYTILKSIISLTPILNILCSIILLKYNVQIFNITVDTMLLSNQIYRDLIIEDDIVEKRKNISSVKTEDKIIPFSHHQIGSNNKVKTYKIDHKIR